MSEQTTYVPEPNGNCRMCGDEPVYDGENFCDSCMDEQTLIDTARYAAGLEEIDWHAHYVGDE